MKFAHKLTKNKAIQSASRLIFTDTETHEQEIKSDIFAHRLKLGCAIFTKIRETGVTNDRYLNYTTKKEFWDNVDHFCKEDTRTYLSKREFYNITRVKDKQGFIKFLKFHYKDTGLNKEAFEVPTPSG